MPNGNPSKAAGFTMVEMLIVIVIISILAAIAIPSYRNYVTRTNRTVAKVALQDIVTRQESYAADHKSYAITFASLGIGSAGTTAYVTSDSKISDSATGAIYTITLKGSANTATCGAGGTLGTLSFRLDAAPVAPQTDAKCGTICTSSTGDRGSTVSAAAAADCWRR